MIDAFSCSFNGKLVKVSYYLSVCVKHEAWNAWGDGEELHLPVTIMQPPLQIVAPQPVVPEGWAPQVFAEQTFSAPVGQPLFDANSGKLDIE